MGVKRPQRSRGPAPSPRVEADASAPLVLAVDTSCAVETLALTQGSIVLAQVHARRPKHRGAALATTIDAVLASVGRSMSDLAAVVVVSGPGAFTGLRVGVATVQGLASALQIPVWPASAMDGWAFAGTAEVVGVTLDARRGEVYTALFRRTETGLHTERGLDLQTPDAWAKELAGHDGPVQLVGDGARLHADLFREVPGLRLAPEWVAGPNLAPLAMRVDLEATPPAVVAVYLRAHDGTRTP
jgi:tRNA threonylcarbamoyladenosine biosynthesis protein TsaB